MLRKFIVILILFLFTLNANTIAEETKTINIPLVYPHDYNTPMDARIKINSPLEISGTITIGISKTAELKDIHEKRYLVEYFIDGILIYQTIGTNNNQITFNFSLYTPNYSNGHHKITVNFWDKKGPAAIGFMDVIINNNEYLND